ncbi:hypothetical protein BWU74_31840 [Paraburkholderia caledonica]|nr:hypothetical protein BWU74_31840 [Burkholderia sp. Bk]
MEMRMSIYTVERVLWDLHAQPDLASRFRAEPEGVLDGYPLEGDERGLVTSLDVRAMADRGASQMLLFVAWTALQGPGTTPEYMRRMNTRL